MSRTALFGRLSSLAVRAVSRRDPHRDAPSRRDILASLGASLAMPLVAAGCGGAGGRIAIVGGGIAGVHAAFRLHQAGVDFTLFEASDRLGGRMHTGRDLFADGQVCEIGGELIDSNHATLFELAEELDIQLDDRQGGPFAALTIDTYWVDGRKVDEDLLIEQLGAVADGVLADLEAADSDDLAYAALDTESLADWLARRVPLSMYPELHRVLAVAYRGEFGLEVQEQSALNLIYLVGLDTDAFRIFGESDERHHAHLGNDTFVSRMAEQLPEEAVALGHRLVRVSGHGPYRLVFEGPIGRVFEAFDRVVFALPFSTLRRVDLSDLKLSDEKRALVNELGYGTNAKIMAGFQQPVWRRDHGASGSATTDLPFQQCWDTSIGQAGPSAILTNFVGGRQGVDSGQGTPEAWVSEVFLPGLEQVFEGAIDAWDGTAVRMHWPSAPYALGSYTCYLPGQWATWATEGTREGDLHFCGEHASADFQGWMEGAAESGGRVATEILDDLGLPYPAALERLARLRRALPPIPVDRPNAVRSLRARRLVFRAWAELHGRVRR